MAGERLLIVEDERIVAQDLHDMLKNLGYEVVGMAASGENAIEKAKETQPDLILMDIRLKGEVDGVQAAETIWAHYGIPVTYLTAFADDSTLERAKATLPFGYILKPFEERDLRTTIEIALYKHRTEALLNTMEGWPAAALENLPDAVIATNAQGNITFMNPAAESLTGWSVHQIYGKKFSETFRVSSKDRSKGSFTPTGRLSSSPLRPTATLKTKNDQEKRVEYSVNTLKNERGEVTGNIVLFHSSGSYTDEPSAV